MILRRTVFLALLFICTSCSPGNYYSRKIKFGNSYRMIPQGEPIIDQPESGTYYEVTETDGSREGSVIVRSRVPGSDTRLMLLYLGTRAELRLDRMVKTVPLLHGPFGTVFTDKTCFFNREDNDSASVSTRSGRNDPSKEAPLELSGRPQDLPPLTSVSLVRIFRSAPEYMLVSANYESDGNLGSVYFEGTKNGEAAIADANGSYTRAVLTNSRVGGLPDLSRYGIPLHIDIAAYDREARLRLPEASFPQEIALFHHHYGYDAVVRQDALEAGKIVSTRYLQPAVTEEERYLANGCEATFRRELALARSTVGP